MSHAFGKSGFLGLGTIGDIIGGLGVTAGSLFLGPEIGAALDLGSGAVAGGVGGALAGAGLGAAEGAAGGGTPASGALMGGLGGATAGALSGGGGLSGLFGGVNGVPDAAAPGTAATVGSPDVSLPATLGSATGSGGTSALSVAPAGVGGVSPDLASGAISPSTPSITDIMNSLSGSGSGGLTDMSGNPISLGGSPGSDLTTAGLGGTTNPTGATLGAAPSASSGSGVGNILSQLGQGNLSGAASSLGSSLGNGLNNLTWGEALKGAAGAGGLIYNMAQGNSLKNIPGYSRLESEAATLGTQGTQLESYLGNGTLPAGLQASIDQATQSGIQAIKSKYANMGLSGSSMEAQEVATLQQNAAAQGGQLALNLLNEGVNMSGLSSQLYGTLLQTNQAQNQETMSAIGNLVTALGGGVKIPAGGTVSFG